MSNYNTTISPKLVFQYFKEKLATNHPFLKERTLKECNNFLALLNDIEHRHDERERTEIFSKLSKNIVKLWGMMLKDALKTLNELDGIEHQDTIRGISHLKHYLKSFKEFEMLLYGSDKWYRDTIYHQLWFYFVGEYLFSKFNIMNNLINSKKDWYCDPKTDDKDNLKQKARYAYFCVIALCHDLGKPLQKIHSINDAIRKMLINYQFLHFTPFKVEFPLTYGQMLKFLVEKLSQSGEPDYEEKKRLEIVSRRELITKGVIKDNRSNNNILFVKMKTEMKILPHIQALFSTAISELNHGMLSCLLLMESFRRFRDGEFFPISPLTKSDKDKNKRWIQKSYLSSHGILKTIAYHSIESIIISEIDLPYFWVCLVDDLIEWYRPTRAGKDFISPGLCKVQIRKASLKEINLLYCFDKEINDNDEEEIKVVIRFFVDKLERYYHIINIKEFKFIIDVKLKNIKDSKKQNYPILMQFRYEENNEIKHLTVKFKKKGRKIENIKDNKPVVRNENYIEDLIMKGLDKGVTEIYKEIFENEEDKDF